MLVVMCHGDRSDNMVFVDQHITVGDVYNLVGEDIGSTSMVSVSLLLRSVTKFS